MERFTDQPNWHVEIFDNVAVAKWRKEARDIPDHYLWELAAGGKHQHPSLDQGPTNTESLPIFKEWKMPLKEILNDKALDYVRIPSPQLPTTSNTGNSVYRSFATRPGITRNLALFPPLMPRQLL